MSSDYTIGAPGDVCIPKWLFDWLLDRPVALSPHDAATFKAAMDADDHRAMELHLAECLSRACPECHGGGIVSLPGDDCPDGHCPACKLGQLLSANAEEDLLALGKREGWI